MPHRALLALVAVALLSHARAANADSQCLARLAPSSVSLRDTGLDRNRVACGVSGLSIGSRALTILHKADRYEALQTSLFLDYQHLHVSGFEFSIGARLVDYRFTESVGISDGQSVVGPIYVGVLRPKKTNWWGIAGMTGHQFRLQIPMTNSGDDNVTVAASPAALTTLMPSSRLHIHGRVAALLWSQLPKTGADSRAALLASADLSYAPLSLFSLTAGAEAQAGWYDWGLDHVQVRGGFRVRIGREGALEVTAGSVLVGSEESDAVLWFGYRKIANEAQTTTPSRLQEWAN